MDRLLLFWPEVMIHPLAYVQALGSSFEHLHRFHHPNHNTLDKAFRHKALLAVTMALTDDNLHLKAMS